MDKKIGTTNDRQYNYDLLRIICAFMVILIHTNAKYLSPYIGNASNNNTAYVVEQLINIITRFSVPCFVMLSGAFVLNKARNKDFKSFYKKSAIKILLPYLVFCLVWLGYYFLIMVVQQKRYRNYISVAIRSEYGDYWYMAMLVFLYLSVPVLIRIKETVTERQFAIFGIALLLWGIVSQRTTAYQLPYASGVVISYMGYFVLGNTLHNISVKNKKIHIFGSLVIITIMVGIAMWARLGGETLYIFNPYRSFFYPPIVVLSLLVFWIFHNLTIKVNIGRIAKYSFYIYLFQKIIITIINAIWGINFSDNELVSLAVFTILTFVGSLVGAMIAQPIIDGIGNKILRRSERG